MPCLGCVDNTEPWGKSGSMCEVAMGVGWGGQQTGGHTTKTVQVKETLPGTAALRAFKMLSLQKIQINGFGGRGIFGDWFTFENSRFIFAFNLLFQ